jgi:alkyl hydroperoxide reductase subunit F
MIRVYTTEQCPQCKIVKSYLRALGKEYEEYKVTTEEDINEVVKISGTRKVPVIVSGDTIIVGFDAEELKRL